MTLLRPDGALDVRFDLFHSDRWNEIPNEDTRNSMAQDGGMTVKRGRPDESGSVTPTECRFSLNNRNGKYSLRNPFSPLAGLINRNSPVRIRFPGLPEHTPSSVRSTSGGIGDFVTTLDVDKPEGTEAGDMLIAYQCTERANNNTTTPTGGGWRELLIDNQIPVSGEGSTAGIRVWWKVATNTEPSTYTFTHEATGNENFIVIIAAVRDVEPDSIPVFSTTTYADRDSAVTDVVTPSTMPPGSESTELRFVRGEPASFDPGSVWTAPTGFTKNEDLADINGFLTATLASRTHDDRPPEPTGFHTFTVDNPSGGVRGFAGIHATTINIASAENPQVRAAVEVADWPTRWEWSGSDVWSPVQASGITRRLSRQPALKGTIERAVERLSDLAEETSSADPVAYWPMNDGTDATQMAGRGRAQPLNIGSEIQPGRVDGPLGDGDTAEMKIDSGSRRISGPLPALSFDAEINVHWEFSCWVKIEQSGFGGTTAIYDLSTSGDAARWRVSASTTTVTAEGFDDDGVSTGLSTTVSTNILDGAWHLVWLKVRQRTAASVGLNLVVDNDVDNQGNNSGLDNAGVPESIAFLTTSASSIDSKSVSHAVLWRARTGRFTGTEVFNAGLGFRNELPTERVARLSQEESVPCKVIGTSSAASFMGPQSMSSLLSLLTECEIADGGVLFEPRDFGLKFRSLTTMYNQVPVAEFTYNAKSEVVTPFDPVDDDQSLRNDITASRPGGSSARAVLVSGPLSIRLPPNGAGVYDDDFTVNVQSDNQLPNYANWQLFLGTLDETRFPVITFDLFGLFEFGKIELLENAAAMDVSQRFTIDNLPPWVTGMLIDQLVFGFDETITEFAWEVTTNNVPASPFDSIAEFAEDNETPPPDSPSRYDSLNSRTFSEFNAGVDTELSVETLFGQLWTQNDGGVLLRSLPGEAAETPDDPALDITGDIDIRCDATFNNWGSTPDNQTLVAKYDPGTDQRSYWFLITAAGELRLQWTTDGTAATILNRTADIGVPAGNNHRVAVRATLDVDDGAGNHVVTFYSAPTIDGPWVQLGEEQSAAGTTSIFSSDTSLRVGAFGPSGDGAPAAGIIHAAEVRDGIDGTVVANPDFTKRSEGVFPSEAGTQGSSDFNLTTSHLVQMPGTVEEDDLLVATVMFGKPDAFPAFPDVPTGWFHIGGFGIGGGPEGTFGRLAVFARVADGTEGATSVDITTSNTSRFAAATARIINALPDIENGVDNNSTTAVGFTNPDPPEVTAPWGRDRNLFIACAGWGDDAAQVTSFPTGYSGLQVHADSGLSNQNISAGMAFRQLIASRDNPTQFQLQSDELNAATTLVVRPAVSSSIMFTDDAGRVWTVSGIVNGDLPLDVNLSRIQLRAREIAYERPILVDVQSVASGTTGSFTVPAPTGLQEGDLLVAFHATDVGSLESGEITGGTEWTRLGQVLHEDSSGRVHVDFKFAGASEPSDYTVTQDAGADGVVAVAAVRGARGFIPIIAIQERIGSNTAISTLPTNPVHESFELRWASSESGATYTPPDGFEEQADLDSGGFVGGTLGTRYAPANDTGLHDFTASASVADRVGVTVNVIGVQSMLVDQQPINAQPGQTRLIPAGEAVSLWTPAHYAL